MAIPNKLLLSLTKDLVLDEDLLLLLAILARLKNTYQCIQANLTNDPVFGAVNMTRDLVKDMLLDESQATSTKLLMTKDLVMAMELHLVLTVLVVDGAKDLVMEVNQHLHLFFEPSGNGGCGGIPTDEMAAVHSK